MRKMTNIFKNALNQILGILPCQEFQFGGFELILSCTLSFNHVCAVEKRQSPFRFEARKNKRTRTSICIYPPITHSLFPRRKKKLIECFEPDLKEFLQL